MRKMFRNPWLVLLAPTLLTLTLTGCVIESQPSSSIAASPLSGSVPAGPNAMKRAALAGVAQQVAYYYSVNPDCSSAGYPRIRVTTPPSHGTATVTLGEAFPGFHADNQRYECNKKKSPATVVTYTSDPAFTGTDAFTIEVVFPEGDYKNQDIAIRVE